MNKISKIRNLIFIIIGIFLCILPINVKAEEYDYEAGFVFYTYVPGEYRRLRDRKSVV